MASYKLITGGTFDGTLCNDKWAANGNISDGTECIWSQAQTASESGSGGFMGKNNGDFPNGSGAVDHGGMPNMIPPEGFAGDMPNKFN